MAEMSNPVDVIRTVLRSRLKYLDRLIFTSHRIRKYSV